MSNQDTENPAVVLYKRVMLVSIVLNMIVAVIILFRPDFFTHTLHQPDASPDTWPRHWGAQLVAINLLYLPGYWQPLENRWPNWCGVGIRLCFAVFFFTQSSGFHFMGIYDGSFGLALLLTYARALKSAAATGAPTMGAAVS